MKQILMILFMIISIPSFGQELILVGKSFPFYRTYISNIDDPIIVVESGGSNMKMAEDYVFLKKIENGLYIKKNKVIAISDNKKVYIYKKQNKLFLRYENQYEKRNFKLKESLYCDKIDESRFDILWSYIRRKKNIDWNKAEEMAKRDFNKFKNSPYKYLNDL